MDMEIKITKTTAPKAKPADESKLGFGKVFTDHMFVMDYSADQGWHDARIVPFDYLPIHPAASVLHYGTEIFEGLKAYRTVNGDIALFRPIENIRRMNNSAERLCLPQIDEDFALKIFDTLVELEKDWVPHSEGTSLYIRPFMIGNDENLGVHAVHNAKYVVILSPSGAYYAEGINPVKIAIEAEDVRAVRGGTGYAKCGGNYAASLRAGQKAEEKGFTTPKLTGSVLPGITRKSCCELLRDKGYTVSERLLSIDELEDAARQGTLEEAWGTGTAAVVSPIGWLSYKDDEFEISNGKIGDVTQMLYDELTGIQWGKLEDKYGWIHKVC